MAAVSIWVFAVLSLVGCTQPGAKTQSDEAVNLRNYRTYAWLTQDDARRLRLSDPKFDYMSGEVRVTQRPEVEEKLKKVIEQDLQAKGYKPTNAPNPDFYVTYYGRAKNQDWVSTWKGATPAINNVPIVAYPHLSQAEAYQYRDGTLLLVLYDPRTARSAWTGSIYHALDEKNLNEAAATVSINDLLAQLPGPG